MLRAPRISKLRGCHVTLVDTWSPCHHPFGGGRRSIPSLDFSDFNAVAGKAAERDLIAEVTTGPHDVLT